MSNKRAAKADVLQGTLDLMVLQTLSALGALHITAAGRRQLAVKHAEWDQMAAIIHTLRHRLE